jgi:hypothetical protein
MSKSSLLTPVLLCVLAIACGGDDASTGSTAPPKPRVGFMYPCETTSDCLPGLSCANKGLIAGLCSKPCTMVDECTTSVDNPRAYCQTLDVLFCAQTCSSPDDCPTHDCLVIGGSPEYCVP